MNKQLLSTVLFLAVSIAAFSAEGADLAFTNEGEGLFAFDTGVVKGTLRADGKSQGIFTLVDCRTGLDLAYGGNNPGILSYYRVFETNKRYKGSARNWPHDAEILPDGALRVEWPSNADRPFMLSATYRWSAANTLDLETAVTPDKTMKDFEVFLSSYFRKGFRGSVYAQNPRHADRPDTFVPTDGNPLNIGTYLAFPRDLRAAQLIYDGRWEIGQSPVQMSVSQFHAAPIAMRTNEENDITFLQMARPEDCFAIEMAYNLDPPDGVANHYSMYFSFFGGDVPKGKTVRAQSRVVIGRGIDQEEALALYKAFLEVRR